MARTLIVGCGCRGRELAAALVADGHAVRGTTRDEKALPTIEAAGAEAAIADPYRLATIAPLLEGVNVLCWLLGTANGDAEAIAALHGPRLESLLEAIVDTPVRGFVYEAAGTVPQELLEHGAGIVARAAATYRMPAALVEAHPHSVDEWRASAAAAVARVLSA